VKRWGGLSIHIDLCDEECVLEKETQSGQSLRSLLKGTTVHTSVAEKSAVCGGEGGLTL